MIIERNPELSGKELNTLLATHGWGVSPDERLEKSFAHLWGWVAARDNNGLLIGFAGILSDGIFHAYIHRLIVHPIHRGHGVGTALMREMLTWIEGEGLQPTLVAVAGKEPFYEKFGFATQNGGCTAMCIRHR